MRFPTLPQTQTTRTKIDVFGGYNHNLRINENEFYDMQNMSSDYFPLLSARKQRGVYATPTDLKGMIAKDKLCYIDGDFFVKSDLDVNNNIKQQIPLTEGDKKLVSLGAYVIILPDKKYINSSNLSDNGDIDCVVTLSNVKATMCTLLGAEYEISKADSTPPAIPEDESAVYWIDTSERPHVLKQYSYSNKEWVTIPTTYIKLKAENGSFNGFNDYDGIQIQGITNEALKDYNGSAIIYKRGEDYIVISGILEKVTDLTEAVTFSRKMPELDFVIESNNRLWGCRYHTDDNGQTYNEIYASKLGDFKNWECFLGVSTDSYRVSVGSNGAFTGAISHLGYPIFFKENYLHKVYGNQPSNYSVQTTACRGVQKGCSKSLAIVNEVLYYKSLSGVCAYDGSLPIEVSRELGDITYFNASAGAHGNKYYISMCDKNDEYTLFVYDVAKKLWHKEDNSHILEFCSYENELYFIDNLMLSVENEEKEIRPIKTMFGYGITNAEERTAIDWMVETGVFGFDTPDKKYISNITIRLDLDVGSRLAIYIQYDSSGVYIPVCALNGSKLKSASIPIRPERCDHFRLKITGYGYSKIYSITKTLEQGSER